MRRSLVFLFAAIASTAVVLLPSSASAHGEREAGGLRYVVGWANEPAYVDELNAVSIAIERGGQPVSGAERTLKVVVQLGDRRTEPLALEPVFGEAGTYEAPLIPTTPGDYTFRFTGTVGEDRVDQSFTATKDGFDEVKGSRAIAFPAQAPSRAELAAAIEQLRPEVDDAADAASGAGTTRILAGIAIAIGLVALATALRRTR